MSVVTVPVVNDLVRLLPENFPGSGRSTLVNRKVLIIDEFEMTIKNFTDEFTTDEAVFSIPIDMGRRLQVITQEEVDTASTCWHRQHVAFVDTKTQTWYYGQVDGLAFPTSPRVTVTTLAGIFEVELANESAPIVPVFPVVATLLGTSRFQFALPSGSKKVQKSLGIPVKYSVRQLEAMHRLVYGRVCEQDDDDEDVDVVIEPNIADVLRGIVADKEMPSPLEVRSFVNPYSGDQCLAKVIHVLLQTQYHGKKLPSSLVNQIGVVFCTDPMLQQPAFSQPAIPRSTLASVALLDGGVSTSSPTGVTSISNGAEPPMSPSSVNGTATQLTQVAMAPTIISPRLTAAPQALQPPVANEIQDSMNFPNVIQSSGHPSQTFHMRLANDPAAMAQFHGPNSMSCQNQTQTWTPQPTTSYPGFPSRPYDRHGTPPPNPFLPIDMNYLASYMRQVPTGLHARGFDNNYSSSIAAASLQSAADFMASHRQRVIEHQLLTLDDCWASYASCPKDAKYFTVTKDEFEFHWWITSPQFRSKQPAQFLTDCITTVPEFFMVPHPGVLMFTYRLAFGSGQLSLWHFRKVTDSLIRTWNDTDRVSLTTFPAKLLPPPVGKLTSLRDLQDALTNFQSFANYYGSASLQQFAHAARSFLDAGLRQLHVVDSDTSTLLQWYDSQFQQFSTELFLDIQQHRDPPRHVVAHYCFDPSGPRFSTLLLHLTSARSLPPPSPPAVSSPPATESATKNQQRGRHGGPTSNPLPPMPENLQRLVPKQDGVPCC